ncbi:glucoamylase family protein [Thiofaba sp. EF100]|uniref:glucoamylase family protein n=1 Tax=Thiofaba sp. EF100 TaxID=3121274 RepID=UPI003221422D
MLATRGSRPLHRLLHTVLILLCLTLNPARAAELPHAMLADFNDGKPLVNRVIPWPGPSAHQAPPKADLTASPRRGKHGLALRVRYDLTAPTAAPQGLLLRLPEGDVAAYDHLSLWVRGSRKQGTPLQMRVRFLTKDTPPASQVGQGFMVVGVNDEWRQLLIPLNALSGVTEGTPPSLLFLQLDPELVGDRKGVFFLDDVSLVRTGQHVGPQEDRAVAPGKKAWEMARGGELAARASIRARAIELPPPPLVRRESLPTDNLALLMRVARDTWRGLDGLRDKPSGLPFDTVTVHPGGGPPLVGDYTNITNIGLYLMSVVAARDLGFITPKAAEARLRQVVGTLEKMETWQGFFFNYYDTTSLERTSHFISFVDSSWLTAGLMVARMAEPDLYPRITRLLERENYAFFYDPSVGQMTHGYHVQRHERSKNVYGLLYSEPRLGSLIAIGKGDVPESHWFSLARTFPADWTWQTMIPLERTSRLVKGHQVVGGYYTWEGIRFLPSWGGSMFEAMMPGIVLDGQAHAPASLGRNAVAHVDIQRRYAQEVLSLPVWGMSPSANPAGGYGEYGIAILGVKGYAEEVVTPHASGLAAMVRPDEAAHNLRQMAQLYAIYGPFGFYDAVNPMTGDVAYKYLALDQGMMFLGLANHLRPHLIQRYFAADPITRRVLPLLGAEDFFQ